MPALEAFIPLLLIVVVFWLFIVRPARRQRQKFTSLQDQLQPGLEVMTTSGIFAEIVSLGDAEAHLRIADGVVIRVHRQAIGQIVEPEALPGSESVDGD